MSVAFTGIGIVSPIGIGKKKFWSAVINNDPGLSAIKKIPSLSDFMGGEIEDLDFNLYISDRKFRRAAEISKYALVATKLAMEDEGSEVNEKKIALIMGITHGSLNYTQQFHANIVKNDIDAISPILFSDSVLNAPAGNISICFGIKGPVHTIVGGADIVIKAIMLGSKMLANGSVDKAIVVASEELNELSLSCYYRKGSVALSEGAGAIVMRKEGCLEKPPYCYISGISSRCNPSCHDNLNVVIDDTLKMANIKPSEIGLILTDSPVNAKYMNSISVGSIIPFTGHAFSATTIWHIILSCLALKNSDIPMTIMRNNVPLLNSTKKILICSTDEYGNAAAVILSK